MYDLLLEIGSILIYYLIDVNSMEWVKGKRMCDCLRNIWNKISAMNNAVKKTYTNDSYKRSNNIDEGSQYNKLKKYVLETIQKELKPGVIHYNKELAKNISPEDLKFLVLGPEIPMDEYTKDAVDEVFADIRAMRLG